MELFAPRKESRDGLDYTCRICRREMYKRYRESHKAQYAAHEANFRARNVESLKEYRRRVNRELKIGALNAYSSVCKCCGEDEVAFLTIDHIDGNGKKHREQIGRKGGADFYRWLKQHSFPVGFQVLCFNCNVAKHTCGICPHQDPSSLTYSTSSTSKSA